MVGGFLWRTSAQVPSLRLPDAPAVLVELPAAAVAEEDDPVAAMADVELEEAVVARCLLNCINKRFTRSWI